MSEPAAALPEGAVLLHVGPQKTGTTTIQGMLAAARDGLAAHGVTYPGRRSAQHDEARVVLGRPAGWAHDNLPLPDEKLWRDLVRTVRAAPGRVVVSSEYFASCGADQRARIVDELGRDRLHLVVAARNPGSLALSQWQQALRAGRAGSVEDWLLQPFQRPEPTVATTGFWSWADAATLVGSWSQSLELDRIRVVVIDETDRTLLPAAFEQLLGLPARTLSDSAAPPSQNRSLTAPEAELLRRTTELTKDQLRWKEFSLFYRTGYANRLLDARVPPRDEARPVLPAWAVDQAITEAGATIERLRASKVTVIGDLENLRRVPEAGDARTVEQVPVDLAAEALAGVITAARRSLRKAEVRSNGHAKTATEPPRPLEQVSTRELAAMLRARLWARVGRRTRP